MKAIQILILVVAMSAVIAGGITLNASAMESNSILCSSINCSTYTRCNTKCLIDGTDDMVWIQGPALCPGQTPYWCAYK